MKDRIKVIFTGGTIGSFAVGDNISPDDNARFMLLQKYGERTGESVERFATSQPISLLSENAVLDDVLKMAEEIKNSENEDVKGIIMTHGSDTLAFTGAYLGLLLPKIKIPVVLVASNLILTDERANGVDNFISAVKLIDSGVEGNIYIAYKNPEDDFVGIHLGTRLMLPPPYSDSYYSPYQKRFALFKEGKLVLENTQIQRGGRDFDMRGRFCKKCLFTSPYTGLNYNVYKGADFDYVLHDLYHSGTANTREGYEENNLIQFAKYCKERGKPIYLCNIKKKDVNYDSTNKMIKEGITFLYDILPHVALAKLNIAYNLIDENEREEYLSTTINGEMLRN